MSKEEMNSRGFETILVEESYDKVLKKLKEAVELYIKLDCIEKMSAETMEKSKSPYTKLQVLLFQKLIKGIVDEVAMLKDLKDITSDRLDKIVEGSDFETVNEMNMFLMISSIMD